MKLLICDFDGTLVESKEAVTFAINLIRKERHALPPLSPEEVVSILDAMRPTLEKELFGPEAGPEDREAFRREYARCAAERVDFVPGMRSTLEQLVGQGVLLAVATNGSGSFPRQILRARGAEALFRVILGADDVPRPKPAPDMLLEICRRLDRSPDRQSCCMLGDSLNDMLAARAARMRELFAGWGYMRPAEKVEIVHRPEELLITAPGNYL